MHIENRGSTAFYRFLIAALAGFGLWLEFSKLGLDTLRLFSGWFLTICTIYYLINTFTTLFVRRYDAGRAAFPKFQGALVVSGMTLLVGQIAFYALDVLNPGPNGLAGSLIYDIVPVLVLMDWILFSEKGHWRIFEPFYWLALPTSYVCSVLITAVIFSDVHLKYPYEFLDWPEIGIDTMLWQLAIIALLMLCFSYLCWLIDFAMSGHLAENIVLPRIKTIIIEEDLDDAAAAEEDEEVESVIEEAAELPSAEEIAAVGQIVDVKVEGLRDKKSANKVHGTKPNSSAKSPQVVKVVSKSGAKEIEIGEAPEHNDDHKPKQSKSAATKVNAKVGAAGGKKPALKDAKAAESGEKTAVKVAKTSETKAKKSAKAQSSQPKTMKAESSRSEAKPRSGKSPSTPEAKKSPKAKSSSAASKPDPE